MGVRGGLRGRTFARAGDFVEQRRAGGTRFQSSSIGRRSAARRRVAGWCDANRTILAARPLVHGVSGFRTARYIQGFSATTKDVSAGGFESVPPDPSDVHLGDSLDGVKKLHPEFHTEAADDGSPQLVGKVTNLTAGVVYEFQGGRVRSFQWGILDPGLPELPPLADPPGDSTATAVLDLQKTESQGTNWEALYLGYHRCDGQTPWNLTLQSTVRENGHVYDRLHVACPTTKTKRDFYFDITSYFGKL